MTEEKWRELTAKASKGDNAAFEELYNASKRSVYFICTKMLSSEHDAKDAMQNTYITAYQKLSSLDDGANFLKWINGIATNKCREFFHGKAAESLDEKLEEGIEFADEEFIPEDYVTDMERRRIIMNIIETELSDVQRQTVILYYYNQLTVSQIADEMSCPENTVKYRLCAAREKIREAVLIYEKEHDDRLHAIMPIPVLTRIFRTEAEQISVPDIPLHLPKAASAPANTLLKKAGGSKMKNAIAGKIIAGVVALGVIGGGIAIAVNSSKDKEPTEVKAPVQVEESSTPTEVTEPITDDSAETTVTEATTTTAAGSTTPEDTSESISVSENENEDSDYNFWRLG
ncbi:MAG: sigma-70 family RNA polymerase sigma factor, partial [Ruminococcus sp.]|nr:sigma-70 family RNA polymerase sigma factor [Ruminococcus sp.]